MLEFKQPIPVIVEDGKGGWEDGYAIYVTNSGMFEDDVWTISLCREGVIRHYTTSQVRMYINATFGIEKNDKT
jgi:hypothetical protein